MKIRHPCLLQAIGCVGAELLRRWLGTLDYQYRPLGADMDPGRPGLRGRYIYAMWHEYLLLPLGRYPRSDIHVLVSRSADGQILAEVCSRLQVPVVRGSTRRGGVEAIRGLLRAGCRTHLAVTPDGPRGPRQRVQPGLVYLAARTGLPVVPVGFGLRRPWRLRSWDQFAVPRPWDRARCVTGEPIRIPCSVNREEIDHYCVEVEEALIEVTSLAEDWAETGAWVLAEKPATHVTPAGAGASAKVIGDRLPGKGGARSVTSPGAEGICGEKC